MNRFPWTHEQRTIIESCPEASKTSKGQLVRVTAAAGTGKTSTLLGLAVEAAKKGFDEITYVTFNKAAATDGASRIQSTLEDQEFEKPVQVEARTIHSAAYRALRNETQSEDEDFEVTLWGDKQLKKWIWRESEGSALRFLQPCYQVLTRQTKNEQILRTKKKAALRQVLFFIEKSLAHFCQRKWNEIEYKNPKTFGRFYFPAKQFHRGGKMGFDPYHYSTSKIEFYVNEALRLWRLAGDQKIITFNFLVKRAQLERLPVPGAMLLLDESQDMDECQVDWLTRTQVSKYNKVVYVVGDAAQAIYGFRGAKSQYLMQMTPIGDYKLTTSFRFGQKISRIANTVLFAKEKSPQSEKDKMGNWKNWIPYTVRAEREDGYVTTDNLLSEWKKLDQITLIARGNVTLLFELLPLLRFDRNKDALHPNVDVVASDPSSVASHFDFPKVHINGKGELSGGKKWRSALNEIEYLFQLFERSNPRSRKKAKEDCNALGSPEMFLPGDLFPEFAGDLVTWKSFLDEVNLKKLTKYGVSIKVVEKLRHSTMVSGSKEDIRLSALWCSPCFVCYRKRSTKLKR